MTRLTPEEAAAVRMEREILLAELRRLDAMLAAQPAPRHDDPEVAETVRMLLPGAKPVPPKPLPPGLSLRTAAAIADLIEQDFDLRGVLLEDPDSVTGDETIEDGQ